MIKFLIKLVYSSILLVSFVYAQDISQELTQKLQNIKTFKANFTQDISSKGKKISDTKGVLYLSRPGRFVWDTKDPIQQKIIADGERFWIYDVDLEQVTMQLQKNLKRGTAALFLSSIPEINKFYTVAKENFNNLIIFKLYVKKPDLSQIKSLNLVFKKDLLTAIVLEDEIGQVTHIKFINITQNIPLDKSIFNFIVPKGVDLIKI